jgi:hypothetical protein
MLDQAIGGRAFEEAAEAVHMMVPDNDKLDFPLANITFYLCFRIALNNFGDNLQSLRVGLIRTFAHLAPDRLVVAMELLQAYTLRFAFSARM